MSNSYNPMNCGPPGSSVHGISQAKILEWVAISFSRESSQARDQTQVYCIASSLLHCRWILYQLSQQGSPLRLGIELLSQIWTCSALLGNAEYFYKCLYQFRLPPVLLKVLLSEPNFVTHFNFCKSGGCAMVSSCSFNLIDP